MFGLVFGIIVVAVIGSLVWDARRHDPTPGARALAGVAGIAACTWLSYPVMDEARRASLTAPTAWQLVLAGLLPSLVFVLSLRAARIRWRGAGWLGYLLPAPVGIVLLLAASDGASIAFGVLGWCLVLWGAAATPSAARAARGLRARLVVGVGQSPIALVAVWSILIFPVTLLTGFTDDYASAPATISATFTVTDASEPYAIRIEWPDGDLMGPAWQALAAEMHGAAWDAGGVWLNGTGPASWQVRLLADPFFDDTSSLEALGNATVTTSTGARVSFVIHVMPGGCHESLSADAVVAAGTAPLPTRLEAACV